MLPDPAREQVLAALATERKLAYATLSAHRAPESSRPDLQNFEAHRSLRTIRIVNHALGLNSGSLPSLPLDLSAIITALRQALVDGSRRPSNVDLALIDSLAAIVAAREAAPALVPTDFEPPVAQSLVDPSARCRRALDGDNPFSLCDLQAHVWNIIADRGAESEKNLAAYACLLALRDGSTISPQTVAEAIACLPRDLLSLEYFCIRSLPVYGSDRPGPATYIAVLTHDPDTRDVFEGILRDEAFHMNYTRKQLERVAPRRHGWRLWVARLHRFWKVYLRFASAFASVMGAVVLTVQYFVVLPVFALAAKRSARREALGWTPAAERPHSFTGQYG